MLLRNVLHVHETSSFVDGTRRGMTIIPAPAYGVRVWTGRLNAATIGKEAGRIVAADYVTRETANFCNWLDVWSYFKGGDYDSLARKLREIVEFDSLLGNPPAAPAACWWRKRSPAHSDKA